MRIDARRIFRSNGLIDDFVLYGKPEDYLLFAEFIGKAISSRKPTLMLSESEISIQIFRDETKDELFTSLQNETNEYHSMDDWNARNVLKIFGSDAVLTSLQTFLVELSGRGEGYSYITEFSEVKNYSSHSPEWRLHVETT